METLFQNKHFIKVATILVILLSVAVLGMLIIMLRNGVERRYHDGQPIPSISVSGTADVMAVSDIASLSFTLSKDAGTAKEAQNLLNDSIKKVLAYLSTTGIADKDIKSEYGGLNPKYDYNINPCYTYPCPQKEPKIIGYTATQSIVVKVRIVDDANTIKTGLASVGVTMISGPTFSIDDEDAYKDQAREKAILDARQKAQLLAKQLHVRLGKITSFSESGNNLYPMMYATKEMSTSSDGAMPPTLPKGENKITSNVTITYEIR